MRYKSRTNLLQGIVLAGLFSIVSVVPALAADGTLDAPERVRWSDENETLAAWRKVDDATGYQLRLYYDDEYIQTVHVDVNRADLSEYMTQEGWYYYEVRAVAENKAGVKYMESSEYSVSEDLILEDLGEVDGK